MKSIWLSIIIPCLNEAENLQRLLPYLWQHAGSESVEILVIDAGSQDNSLEVARSSGASFAEVSDRKGRGPQMNYGAQQATGEVLYFVHADTLPPPTFVDDIRRAIGQGHEMGCYRFRFAEDPPMLRLNAYFTRFPLMICRGGDQSLFASRVLFDRLNGYDEQYLIMEEYDFIRRAKKHSHFHIMSGEITVSARKYVHNSYPRVNLANLIVFSMFFLGVSQQVMVNTYRRLLNYR